MKEEELAWAGGFFEGEGCFYAHPQAPRLDGTRRIVVQANVSQKDLWPLEKFQQAVNLGTIYSPNKKGVRHWEVHKRGEAKKLFVLLEKWLGPRRQKTAKRLFKIEDSQIKRHRNGDKTRCKYGHLFDEENTYTPKKGGRQCKTCYRRRALEYYYRKKKK